MCSVLAAALLPQVSSLALLADGLDQLQREDPLDLPSAALGERLRDLVGLRDRLDAAISRHVAALDRSRAYSVDGAPSAASWLRTAAHLSPNAASEHVRVARQLDRLPDTAGALDAGELGFQHCQVITRMLEDAGPDVVREAEPALLQAARRADPYRLAIATRHLRHAFDPEGCAGDARRAHERRRLHLSESLDGLFLLDGTLDAEGGATLRTALDAVMGPPAGDDVRTPAQRRADALVDLARRQLDGGELPVRGGQRPHLTLTADLATLAKLPGSPAADLDWGQPVPSETARRLACDAIVTPVLLSETGDPLSVGRARRTIRGPQRKALVLRDRGCVLCGRPATWCAGDHLRHRLDGGPTSLENSALLCGRCHTRVHEGGWRLVRGAEGTFVAVPP